MNKIILLLFLGGVFLFGMPKNYWWIIDTIYLKKDYFATYEIEYDKIHKLKFRFTLYKNHGIVMFYNYDNHQYQNILYDDSDLNIWRKQIVDWRRDVRNPYFIIVFEGYKSGVAQFALFLYNPEQNIQIKLKPKELRNRDYVKNLPDIK